MDNDPYKSFYISISNPSNGNGPTQLSGASFGTQYPSPVASDSISSQHADSSSEVGGHLDQVDDNSVVSLSTGFYPKGDPETDTVFMSSDRVHFYTNYKIIIEAALNAFRPCLIAPLSDQRYRSSVIYLDAPSPELNIILHALYKTSPAANSPTFEELIRAIDRMPRYALLPGILITPGTPVYELLLSHAPLYPLDSYALAAHHDIAALASTVSTHLLSHDVRTISDIMAERIGSIYLKRLLLLHTSRFEALKDILLHAPIPHPETPDCSFLAQRKVTRAWALVSAYLVWDVKPDTSTLTLSQSLNTLLDHVTCKECEKILKDKIKDVMVRWTAAKRSI